ncbi:MAG: sensor histidine kinase [Variovorax sp.]
MTALRTEGTGRFGIRARLLTLLLPGILGLLVLDSWNDYRALNGLVQDAYDRSMLESATALQASVSPGPDGALRLDPSLRVQTMIAASRAQQKHLHVGLTPSPPAPDAAGAPSTLMGDADLPRPAPADASASSASSASMVPSPVWYDGTYQGRPIRVVALHSQVIDGRGRRFDLLVQEAEGMGPRDQVLAASSRQALLRDARMLLVVTLLVWLGVNWSLRPLERLRKSVLQSKGQALEPLDTRGVPHEVAPLVDAVNQHVESYRELLDEQSQFLADASHQLRTPLAIMLTQAGVALREKDPDLLRETLHAIVAQISRSRRLCEQLLSLAHASDSAPPADTPQRVDLNTIAKEVVLQYLALAHEKDQDLGWVDAGPDLVTALASGPELHEALANLVHNAIVYTPVGGHVTVTAAMSDGVATIEVRDDGPGIAPAQRAEVFERFQQGGQRTGSASGKRLHGAGLGLAIARAYARRNGGDIELVDADAPGLRIRIRLAPSVVPQR